MTLFLLIAFGYLMGSIPTGIWVGKHFHNIDIREHGSGNSGSTNAFRVLGKLSGSVVLMIDILKGYFPTVLALVLLPNVSPLIIGVASIIGHTFPIFAQFKGGKAVATTAGVLLAIYPLLFIIGVTLFLILLFFTRIVSLSSMVTAIILTILSYLLYNNLLLTCILSVLAIFIIYRHRTNIIRIKNGTENKVPFGWGYKR
ncbi:glycerol-3-phosphate 1-O-acyltransferase PlsY [Carnobacteriaceae bacterium zg-ZUI252]|nr:glycerol-3-phosphate 1-O-acyltransferase PlsY [Carnobacteriaceae bacterium zg-ZUI252]